MPETRPKALYLIACLLLLVSATAGAQQRTVSRNPPPPYASSAAPLLTSTEEVLELSKALRPDPAFGGAVILNEIVHHVDQAGARLVVVHSVYRADSDAGAEQLAQDTQSFRAATQKIHLALAQAISPDGTRTPVRENAALIQSPQRRRTSRSIRMPRSSSSSTRK